MSGLFSLPCLAWQEVPDYAELQTWLTAEGEYREYREYREYSWGSEELQLEHVWGLRGQDRCGARGGCWVITAVIISDGGSDK